MTTTRCLLAFSGSLRQDSYNQRLLHVACQAARQLGAEVTEVSLREYDLPLFSEDLEQQATPAQVTTFKQQVAAADGLLIACPEYNGSFTAALKNAIDWLSRPSDGLERVFLDKPVAVIGASPGGFGTVLAQNAWLPVLRSMGARHWSAGRLMVSAAGRVFDETGALTDDAVRQRLEGFIDGFERFCDT